MMHIDSLFGKWLLSPALALALFAYLRATPTVNGQTAASENVVVTGDDVTSAYGAPGGFSRARFAPTTSAYVLPPKVPDAYEFRLLLAQDFGDRIEWAMNWFFEKENTGDRGREWGFAQSASIPVLLERERLKVGVEMEYKNFTVKDTRGDPMHSFVIGPTMSFRSSKNTRFDVSTLFGCTDDSPRVQVFAIFSFLLGPGTEQGAEAPVSTRNR